MKIIFTLCITFAAFTCFSQDCSSTTCSAKTKNDYKKLIAKYTKLIDKEPKNQLAYYQVGLSYYSLANFKMAMVYFEKLIALNPKYRGANNNMAICKLLTKDKEGACTYFKLALANGEDDKDVVEGKSIGEYVKENCASR